MNLSILLVLFVLSGCSLLSTDKPPGPWADAYQPITDPSSDTFISEALKKAQVEFGEPVIPINTIHLRRSRKTVEARRYRIAEDFSLTECADPTNGVFVIYIGDDPGSDNYYALLAHECVHLLHPYVMDWYMEGIATVFSEEVCSQLGGEWGDWKKQFMKSRRDPYAISYRMMRDLKDAFPQSYPLLVHCSVPAGKRSSPWRRIDIDQWITSLPSERQGEAVKIIESYENVLRKYTGELYSFSAPEE